MIVRKEIESRMLLILNIIGYQDNSYYILQNCQLLNVNRDSFEFIVYSVK